MANQHTSWCRGEIQSSGDCNQGKHIFKSLEVLCALQ